MHKHNNTVMEFRDIEFSEAIIYAYTEYWTLCK